MPIIQTHKLQTACGAILVWRGLANVYNYQVCYPAKPYRAIVSINIERHRKGGAERGKIFSGPPKLTNLQFYGEVL
jgi:hypothetical protein